MILPGTALTAGDLEQLERSGIPRELASQALLRRVDSAEGAANVGRNGGGDYAGILIPYVWPGEQSPRGYRLRRDHPPMEQRADGSLKESEKYLGAPGAGNKLYLVPGTDPAWLEDTPLPVVITEGEKKCLALAALAEHGLSDAAEEPSYLPIALAGVYSWRGTIGKAPGPDGHRRDVKGTIPDLDRISWKRRKVTIAFDVNIRDNQQVQAARWELTKELRKRGANVHWMEWPADIPADINGVDDLIGLWGPARALPLIETAKPAPKRPFERPARDPWERRATSAGETAQGTASVEQQTEQEIPDLLSQHLSDYGNAQRLIALYGDDLRYCHALGKWLMWDTRRWAVDDGERTRNLSQSSTLEFARQAITAKNESAAKFAAQCLNSQRITNTLREAQPHQAIRPAELDTHADLLNFTNGTLDLITGIMHTHRREDYITKLVHHNYWPEAKCPGFTAFLETTTAHHPGLDSYLQLALGYSLTGHTSEKAVFLLHGRGDNGKSTLLSTFLKLLEEYAVLLQIDTLMVRQESNNTQADLADLRGARFVMTSETEEGQRLAEGKLKRITQGMGRIKATRKYENPIEFTESHKLWIDANHLPIVRGTDNAIWNRLHPVPFDITIPKAEQDKSLPEKLANEAEGILAWAVAGAVRWYAEGLGKPSDVQQAGDSWRTQSDHIGRFIAETCITGEYTQVKARLLYTTYKRWAEEAGEHPVTETAFGLRITEDFPKKHTNTGAIYERIGLRADGER